MNELAFWEMVLIILPFLLGNWYAYKLGQRNPRWMTLSELIKSGGFALGGMICPSAILWVVAGPFWGLLLLFVASLLETSLFAVEKGRRERRLAQQIRLDRELMENPDAECIRFFHQ